MPSQQTGHPLQAYFLALQRTNDPYLAISWPWFANVGLYQADSLPLFVNSAFDLRVSMPLFTDKSL